MESEAKSAIACYSTLALFYIYGGLAVISGFIFAYNHYFHQNPLLSGLLGSISMWFGGIIIYPSLAVQGNALAIAACVLCSIPIVVFIYCTITKNKLTRRELLALVAERERELRHPELVDLKETMQKLGRSISEYNQTYATAKAYIERTSRESIISELLSKEISEEQAQKRLEIWDTQDLFVRNHETVYADTMRARQDLEHKINSLK